MPEFRKDPLTDSWVIMAEERGQRPQDFSEEDPLDEPREFCPFEPGNEDMTPPEVYAIRPDSDQRQDWAVRVVPNKYPALAIEGTLNREGVGMFDKMNGVGAHEVVIETPEHDLELPDYSAEQIEFVLKAYQDPMKYLRGDRRFRYTLVFKNHRRQAGASLEHPHSQIIALSVTPRRVKEQLNSARKHYREKRRCIFCDILKQELERDERIVMKNQDFVVWSPFAARFPFEMWILPREHSHDYTNITNSKRSQFGSILRKTVEKLRQALQSPPYNYLINTAPNFDTPQSMELAGQTIEDDYHWHLEIIPRITRIAGFEWGTGFYINPTPPEEAARFLREETG